MSFLRIFLQSVAGAAAYRPSPAVSHHPTTTEHLVVSALALACQTGQCRFPAARPDTPRPPTTAGRASRGGGTALSAWQRNNTRRAGNAPLNGTAPAVIGIVAGQGDVDFDLLGGARLARQGDNGNECEPAHVLAPGARWRRTRTPRDSAPRCGGNQLPRSCHQRSAQAKQHPADSRQATAGTPPAGCVNARHGPRPLPERVTPPAYVVRYRNSLMAVAGPADGSGSFETTPWPVAAGGLRPGGGWPRAR